MAKLLIGKYEATIIPKATDSPEPSMSATTEPVGARGSSEGADQDDRQGQAQGGRRQPRERDQDR